MAFSHETAAARIRELALSFPQAYEDAPWGFPVFKVADNKMFAWLFEGDPAEVTVKLSAEERRSPRSCPTCAPRATWAATAG